MSYIGKRLAAVNTGTSYQWVIEGDIASYFDTIPHRRLMKVIRACRKTPLRTMGGLLASLLSLSGSCFGGSTCPDAFTPHLLACTRSRISLFRLKERIERGPAISSVCHRRSLGLLNPYLSVFRVPMRPSVLPRSLRTV